MRKNEQGFVLVTALVLLSILTLAGMASSYKTLLGTKVSKMSVDIDRSMIAAEMGLTQLYWYWSQHGDLTTGGIKEFDTMKSFLDGVGSAPSVYKGAVTPSSVSDSLTPTDAEIQTANSGFKVFTMMPTGVFDTYAWKGADVGANPQVAVWMTTFNEDGPGVYPYTTELNLDGYTSGCPNANECKVVTYALGRSGESKKLLRETQSFLDQKLGGVAAMSNAPKGDTFDALCGATTSASAFDGTSNGTAWPADGTGAKGNNRVLLEVSQAPYVLGGAPSGTALASNTEFGQDSSFGFRKGHSSETGAIFNYTPLLLYSGHGTKDGFKVDWASDARDTTAVDLPSGKLPTKLVDSPMTADDRLDYFSDADTNLFSIDTYRWAAEQLTCQDPTKADGRFGNGIYCSKGENLRQSLVRMGHPAYAPVTGRLTIAQYEYNMANSIPMFGVIRLMLPATRENSADVSTCNGVTIVNHKIEGADVNSQWGDSFAKISALGNYDKYDDTSLNAGDKALLADAGYNGAIPNPDTNADFAADGPYAFTKADGAVVDPTGTLGAKARMVVYGTVVIDYFADYDIEGEATAAEKLVSEYNTVFDPDMGERVLSPLESPDVYFWANIPLLINPVMPRFTGTDPYAFPTGATTVKPTGSTSNLSTTGRVNMVIAGGGSAKAVSLASPYDGYFPWSEGMFVGPNNMGNAGTVRFMSRDTYLDNPSNLGLVEMGVNAGRNTEVTATNADMTTMLAWTTPEGSKTEAKVIKYYYDLMKGSVNMAEPMDWPVAPWPGDDLSGDFCMGRKDCNTNDPSATVWKNNMGDKAHLMFPTGYIHGWKAALAALDIDADEWNQLLSGDEASLKGIADDAGLYKQISNDCSSAGAAGGAGCALGKPYHANAEGFKSQAAVKLLEDNEADYFYITKDLVTGYGLMDSKWQDLPTTIYSGGLIDIHSHTNMSGIMYTPGPLEWGSGLANYGELLRDGAGNIRFQLDSGDLDLNNGEPDPRFLNDDAMSYVNGSIITGYGMAVGYTSSTQTSKYLLVYDLQAVDNVNTNMKAIRLRRYDWQHLN